MLCLCHKLILPLSVVKVSSMCVWVRVSGRMLVGWRSRRGAKILRGSEKGSWKICMSPPAQTRGPV